MSEPVAWCYEWHGGGNPSTVLTLPADRWLTNSWDAECWREFPLYAAPPAGNAAPDPAPDIAALGDLARRLSIPLIFDPSPETMRPNLALANKDRAIAAAALDSLQSKVAELERDKEKLSLAFGNLFHGQHTLEIAKTVAEAECAKLLRLLLTNGRHTAMCACALTETYKPGYCDCGLDAALSDLSPAPLQINEQSR